jgi:hypothetical protein
MKTTRRTVTSSVVAMLAGTLALGACGEAQTTDDAGPRLEQSEAQAAAAKAAAARATAEAELLRQVRKTSPTAGMEVPPASLTTDTILDTIRDNNVQTGVSRADSADIGWPDVAERPRGLDSQGRYPRYVE